MGEPNNDQSKQIHLSEKAHEEALRLQAENPEWKLMALRLYLEGKGCDGFYYGVSFDNIKPEDTVFPFSQVKVIVDPQTLIYVQGSQIEWCDDERGTGFLVENPNHRKFRGKFFKRKTWQDYLTSEEKN